MRNQGAGLTNHHSWIYGGVSVQPPGEILHPPEKVAPPLENFAPPLKKYKGGQLSSTLKQLSPKSALSFC